LLPALAATLEGGAITRTVVRVRPRG
jgi:hypothetical protein